MTGNRVSEICADTSTFLPDRVLDEDANILFRFKDGGKGAMTISQVATGEENNLRLRAYASEGAVQWEQENPNYLDVYRYGQPRETLTRAHAEYLSEAAARATRVPTGHPEGYLEAFANIYCDAAEAIRRHIDGRPMPADEYAFPTVHDGLRGVRFIQAAVESSNAGGQWTAL